MSYSQDDITALKSALAKGATRVKVGDEEVQFRSLSELRQLLRDMEAEVSGASAASRQIYPQFADRPLS